MNLIPFSRKELEEDWGVKVKDLDFIYFLMYVIFIVFIWFGLINLLNLMNG
jgi:hypothetical protein